MKELAMRKGTQDELAYREALLDNQYDLPRRFGPEEVVIDCGAHIGCFSVAALMRGAHRVLAVEPPTPNLPLLRYNLQDYPERSWIFEEAVWRSDRFEAVYLRVQPDPIHTATHRTIGSDLGVLCPATSLDHLINLGSMLSRNGRVRFLKMDIEGAEYGALYSCTLLGLVDQIAVETHQLNHDAQWEDRVNWMNHASMACWLWKQGFEINATPNSPGKPGYNMILLGRRVRSAQPTSDNDPPVCTQEAAGVDSTDLRVDPERVSASPQSVMQAAG